MKKFETSTVCSMESISKKPVFHIWDENNPLIKSVYEKDNYIIREYENDSDVATVYFASNGIYYPDTEEEFRKTIVERDRYEWLKLHRKNVRKEIFLRDVFKCHYVLGINSRINSIDKLVSFLQKETEGMRVITVGNSAGGYAATVVGTCMKAYMVFSFSGQNDITGYTRSSTSPVGRYKDDDTKNRYYSIKKLWEEAEIPSTFFFYSGHNKGDVGQCEQVMGISDYNRFFPFCFDTDTHEKTMYNFNLPYILSYDREGLKELCMHYKDSYIKRFDFSVKVCGLGKTLVYSLGKVCKHIIKWN